MQTRFAFLVARLLVHKLVSSDAILAGVNIPDWPGQVAQLTRVGGIVCVLLRAQRLNY